MVSMRRRLKKVLKDAAKEEAKDHQLVDLEKDIRKREVDEVEEAKKEAPLVWKVYRLTQLKKRLMNIIFKYDRAREKVLRTKIAFSKRINVFRTKLAKKRLFVRAFLGGGQAKRYFGALSELDKIISQETELAHIARAQASAENNYNRRLLTINTEQEDAIDTLRDSIHKQKKDCQKVVDDFDKMGNVVKFEERLGDKEKKDEKKLKRAAGF